MLIPFTVVLLLYTFFPNLKNIKSFMFKIIEFCQLIRVVCQLIRVDIRNQLIYINIRRTPVDIRNYDASTQRVTLEFSSQEWDMMCQLLEGQRYEQTVSDKILSIASHIEMQAAHVITQR